MLQDPADCLIDEIGQHSTISHEDNSAGLEKLSTLISHVAQQREELDQTPLPLPPLATISTSDFSKKKEKATTRGGKKIADDSLLRVRHNAVEQRRRGRLKDRFNELQQVLDVSKCDRITTLQVAIERLTSYEDNIRSLELERESLIEKTGELNEAEIEGEISPIQVLRLRAVLYEQSLQSSSSTINNHKSAAQDAKNSPGSLLNGQIGNNGLSDVVYNNLGSVVFALNGMFLDASKLFQDLVGYSKDNLQMTTMFAITHPKDLGTIYEMIQKTMSKQAPAWCNSFRVLHKNGDQTTVNMMFTLVRHEKTQEPVHFAGFMLPDSQVTLAGWHRE